MSDSILWIGVDPGAARTGLVAMRVEQYVGHALVKRDAEQAVWPYIDHVVIVCAALIADTSSDEDVNYTLAIEDVVAPRYYGGAKDGRPRVTDPAPLLDTAKLIGALMMAWRKNAVLIAPGNHGGNPLGAYPKQLRSPREKRGAGKLRHCRSAWDVAMTYYHEFHYQLRTGQLTE